MRSEKENLFDVVAVNMDTMLVSQILGEGKTIRNAEAIVNFAVMRRGVDEEFYAECPAGSLKVGDAWRSQ